MKIRKATYYKAWLLLIVFSLNTAVSFACSFSAFFHGFHHSRSSASYHHQHDGSHHYEGGGAHEHDDAPLHQHKQADPDKPAEDCCSKYVAEVEKTDKSVSRSIGVPPAVFLTSFITTYLSSITSLFPSETWTSLAHHDRWRARATIQDLRIVIQSFQI